MEIYKTLLDVESGKVILTVTLKNNLDLVEILGSGEWDFMQIHDDMKITTNHNLKLFLIEVMKSLGYYHNAFDTFVDREEIIMYYGEEYASEEYDIPKEEREEYLYKLNKEFENEVFEDIHPTLDHHVQMHNVYDNDYTAIDCDLRVSGLEWNSSIVHYIYEHIDDFAANAERELSIIKKIIIEAGFEDLLEEDIDYSNEKLDYSSGERLRNWRNLYAIFSELSEFKKKLS